MESIIEMEGSLYQKNVNRFLIGLIVYTIATGMFLDFLPGTIVNFIQLIALALCLFYGIKLASWKNIPSWYLRIVISLLFCWEIYIIYHGFIFNYFYLKEYLFFNSRGLQYLIPLTVFILLNNTLFIETLFTYLYRLEIIFFVLLPVLLFYILSEQSFAEQYVWSLAIGGGFILLTSFYQPRKRMLVTLIVMILAFLLVTILARRNIMLTCACFLLFSFLIMPLANKNITRIRKIAFIMSFLIIVSIGYIVFMSNQSGIFSKITTRATENTREIVFLFYFTDIEKTTDSVVGKGLNGTYYCPGIDEEWSGRTLTYRDVDYRLEIECGYLQLLLNGGFIYLVLYLLILLPAIIQGVFFSKNMFCKACAILILLHLIDMVPYGLPTFSLRYFLVWFCVALCYTKEFRMMDEKEMSLFLSPKQIIE
jgi:hypothetical protein